MTEVNSILLLPMCGFGDAVCYLPAAERMRQAFPRARITVLVISDVAGTILEDAGLGLEVIVFNRQGAQHGVRHLFHLIRRLRRARYDLALSGAHFDSPRMAIVAFLSGARRRVGASAERFSFLYTDRVDVPIEAHAYERFGLLVKGAGVLTPPGQAYVPRVRAAQETESKAKALWMSAGLREGDLVIGFASGADTNLRGLWQPALKRWPPERYAELARHLNEEHGAHVVVFGGSQEYAIAEQIRQLSGEYVTNLCGSADVRTLPWLLRRCTAVVTNDTGLMHLAAALDVPLVALFGPTDPAGFAPWNPLLHVVQGHAPCSPCYPRPTCSLAACSAMADISATTVRQELAALLAQREIALLKAH